jgi:hypothetical protein
VDRRGVGVNPPNAQELASAQEAPERCHELLRAFFAEALGLGAEHAVPRMAVEEAERDLLEGALDGADLRDDVDAVAVFLDHALHAADLALDAAEPGDELLLGRAIPACGGGVGHALMIPPTGSAEPS